VKPETEETEVLIIGLVVAKAKKRFEPIEFEFVIPFCSIVPYREVYVPVWDVLPETELKGDMLVGRATEMLLFVKFPAVVNAQYSVALLADKDTSILPPGSAAKASARAVTVPVPVIGFTKVKG
jgi:hypothetical protein